MINLIIVFIGMLFLLPINLEARGYKGRTSLYGQYRNKEMQERNYIIYDNKENRKYRIKDNKIYDNQERYQYRIEYRR